MDILDGIVSSLAWEESYAEITWLIQQLNIKMYAYQTPLCFRGVFIFCFEQFTMAIRRATINHFYHIDVHIHQQMQTNELKAKILHIVEIPLFIDWCHEQKVAILFGGHGSDNKR
jgi:hypothetical protein